MNQNNFSALLCTLLSITLLFGHCIEKTQRRIVPVREYEIHTIVSDTGIARKIRKDPFKDARKAVGAQCLATTFKKKRCRITTRFANGYCHTHQPQGK